MVLLFTKLVYSNTIAPVTTPDVATLRPTVPITPPTTFLTMDPISHMNTSSELSGVVLTLVGITYSMILTIMGIWIVTGDRGPNYVNVKLQSNQYNIQHQ